MALREAQLWILNNPDQIGTIAKTRGMDFSQIEKVNDDGKRGPAAKRSSSYPWAGLVISGSG
jgi:hypothetical protein